MIIPIGIEVQPTGSVCFERQESGSLKEERYKREPAHQGRINGGAITWAFISLSAASVGCSVPRPQGNDGNLYGADN